MKCLVTKLKGNVSNNSLLRLGEFRIKFAKVDSVPYGSQTMGINVSEPVKIEVVGDGYFTNRDFTENKGKVMMLNTNMPEFYVSKNDIELAILDKYKIKQLVPNFSNQVNNSVFGNNKSMNIEGLSYSVNLTTLNLGLMNIEGDISSLSNLVNLTTLSLNGANLTGDISSLSNLVNLTTLSLNGANLTGDISSLSNLVNLTTIYLQCKNITGDISELKNTKLIDCTFRGMNLSGDLALLPKSTKMVYFRDNVNTNLSWSERSSAYNIIAINGTAKLDNVDKMLQDQAQCNVGFNSSDSALYKKISIQGTRTSASDAAVQTLQSKGYTVSITPA